VELRERGGGDTRDSRFTRHGRRASPPPLTVSKRNVRIIDDGVVYGAREAGSLLPGHFIGCFALFSFRRRSNARRYVRQGLGHPGSPRALRETLTRPTGRLAANDVHQA